jgi:hypothetical protein
MVFLSTPETNIAATDACFRRNGVSRATREQYFVLATANSCTLFIFSPPVSLLCLLFVGHERMTEEEEKMKCGMPKIREASNVGAT